ncbi:hypothetical protein EDD36DRAFT_495718 [Exophiala viscosa]|uniref:BTB domain-containing protein n=1 Tax=Exophiala viscosa TaxID=2486360 RepID=A0AAN6DT64_9EURO|nr:hypothetical protein EDD36DRAFT_495718 [Exophiala viscosa]
MEGLRSAARATATSQSQSQPQPQPQQHPTQPQDTITVAKTEEKKRTDAEPAEQVDGETLEDGEELLDDDELGEDEEYEDDDEDDFENFTTSEIVTVYVGHKRKRFFLHRELICERSPFMEKCLKKDRFDEGYKNELYLPEDDPKAFSIVVEWIYRSKLPARTEPTFDLGDLSASYCMADKFGMEELQNSIMDNIRGAFSRRDGELCKPPHFSALALTHLTGPPKSPLKRFYVEHLVHHMMKHPKWYHELKRNEPNRADLEELFKIPDLVSYIMKKIWQFQAEPWKDPATWDKCCYHVHAATVCPTRATAAAAAANNKAIKGPGSGLHIGSGLAGHVHGLGAPGRSWPPSAMGVWNPGVGW